MDLNKIKLIIWDLDDTLWNGTISEENVKINHTFVDFINHTLDMGIVHSICSKNDYAQTKKELNKLGIWDLFVFPSIDWTSKGSRVRTIIEDMNLRAPNVLLVDDNIQNLEEVKFYNKGIMTALPEDIYALIKDMGNHYEQTDLERKRLKQYQILQEKTVARDTFDSNVDFLKSCDIRVEICEDCLAQIDRIHELLMRSNQLNYTKYRQSKEQLRELLSESETKSGYVKVHDNFGDYGLVGFFAIKGNKAVHYLFSCRTLGMAVEQYVYMKLGCPEIQIAGDVATRLNDREIPEWINQNKEQVMAKKDRRKNVLKKVLLKGPCDLLQMFSFIRKNSNIITEFTYTNGNGIVIEGHNHTGQLLTSLCCGEERKRKIIGEVPWFDEKMLTTNLNNQFFDVVVYSLLTDGNLGLYRRKSTGEQIALCEKVYDLTDKKNWDLYIAGKIFTSNINFKKEDLETFSNLYEYVPNDGQITIENLDKIYSRIQTGKFIIMLGSEQEYPGKCNLNYENRHLFHRRLNDLVKQWALDKKNVVLLPIDKYILNQHDFADSINHLSKSTYYRLSEDLISIINEEDNDLELLGKSRLFYYTLRQKTRLCIENIPFFRKSRNKHD